MVQLLNQTPFPAKLTVTKDSTGQDVLLMVVNVSFTLDEIPKIHHDQLPIQLDDVYWGEPEASAMRYAGQMRLPERGKTCILNGHAWAPGGNAVSELDVSVTVGELTQKYKVWGDREWRQGIVTDPEPFVKKPLWEENLTSGASTVNGESRLPLPTIEKADNPIQSMRQWQETSSRLSPEGFDEKMWLNAQESLWVEGQYYQGGEDIFLRHVHPQKRMIKSSVPACEVSATIGFGKNRNQLPLRKECLILEPDEERQVMVMRAVYPCDVQALAICSVMLTVQQRRNEAP